MASNAELEARIQVLEGIILNAVEIPDFMVNISSSVDKTGKWCYGIGVAGINGGGPHKSPLLPQIFLCS